MPKTLFVSQEEKVASRVDILVEALEKNYLFRYSRGNWEDWRYTDLKPIKEIDFLNKIIILSYADKYNR